jgi:endonuclease YncB( thermonuclease family)
MVVARLALFLAISGLACAGTVTGLVVGVADGDTITVLDTDRQQHKIRLAGIDAPEKRQDFGNRSKQSLSDLAYRRQAIVETGKTDRYGRLIGKVLVMGQDVNLEQVRRGMAWHYKAYQREQVPADRQAYAAAEDTARVTRTGLWAIPNPTPPWEFRAAAKTRSIELRK